MRLAMSQGSRSVAIVVASIACLAMSAPPAAAGAQALADGALRDSTRAAILRDVDHLTDPRLEGRATGAPGSDSAAAYLVRRYDAMQVSVGLQSFRLPPEALVSPRIPADAVAHNVIATIPGTDPTLSEQWIVIGAHYDHLGTTGLGTNDEDFPRRPHLGADDNASGTAMVLALARRLADVPTRRPILIAHFGAEEVGLVGSSSFVELSPQVVRAAVAMLNFDMVGRLRLNGLELSGFATSTDWWRLVDSTHAVDPMRLTRVADMRADSDHWPFAMSGVPTLAFHTGRHREYHTTRDTKRRLDIEGMLRITDFAERLIRSVGDRDAQLERTRSP